MSESQPVPSLKIIEVAMEIALPPALLEAVHQRYGFRPAREVAMSGSVGGIGPLLRERIVEQAERGAQVIGVTLLYETTWIQSWFDWGQVHLEKREVLSYLREFLKDTGIVLPLVFYDGLTVPVRVWSADYGRGVVYFLDAPALTQVVYPSEEDALPRQLNPAAWADELRLKQSWLIGRGALALAKALDFRPDIIVQSETPTVFAHHRLALDAFHKDPFFEETRYVFNDHTPMEYAHPVWSRATLARAKLDVSSYLPPPGMGPHGDVDITRLLVGVVQGVFGVSQKHGKVMRAMPSLKDYADKIESITNGIYVPYWQAPEYQKASALGDAELLALQRQKKAQLLDWVWRHYGLWHTWKEQVQGKVVVLWTRRITGYKRLDLLTSLCKDPSLKRSFLDAGIVLLIGGRVHQHDDQAQAMIYNLLDLISGDPALQERIVLLDNFNVWMAPRLFQGADAAVMLADDGREASATGFMKAQVNGDLIIATQDGAIAESVVFAGQEPAGQAANGFEVPYVNGHPTAEGLVRAFRALAAALKDPSRHAAMIRAALAAEPQVTLSRAAGQMLAFYRRVLAQPQDQPVSR